MYQSSFARQRFQPEEQKVSNPALQETFKEALEILRPGRRMTDKSA